MTGKPGESQLPSSSPIEDEAIDKLRPLIKQGKEDEAQVLIQHVIRSHSGPLPPARELSTYEAALPGAAAGNFEMAEREQAHRHRIDEQILITETNLRKRGQFFALAGLVLMLAIVALLAAFGAPTAAAFLGAAIIVGVVASFLGQSFFRVSRWRGASRNPSQG